MVYRKRDRQMERLEKEIEKKLVKIVRAHGGLCLKWVCPGWSGVPDRIVLMPGGQIFFIELKRPKGGVLSGRQKWWADKLTNMGFEWYQVYSDDHLKIIEEMILNE